MAGLGVSFVPNGQGGDPNDPNAPRSAPNPYQSAIRILSLRLPRVLGAGSLAPAPLLQGAPNGQGPMAQPMAPTLQGPPVNGAQSPLMQMFAQLSGMGQGQAPTPHFTPGVNPGDHPTNIPNVQAPDLRGPQWPGPTAQPGPPLQPGPGTGTPFPLMRKQGQTAMPWMSGQNFT